MSSVQAFSSIAKAPFRRLDLGDGAAPTVERLAGGGFLVRAAQPLAPFANRLTDKLVHWARLSGDLTCIAQRGADGSWRELSYAKLLDRVKAIAAALVKRKLSVERPIMILSGNDIEQLELSLAAMWIGVPVAPVSPAYSLVSTDFAKLRYLIGLMTPGMVVVNDASAYAAALTHVPADVEIVAVSGDAKGRYTAYSSLVADSSQEMIDAHQKVGPDTIAKFLFTSGSTKQPKAVPNTQRMLCSNQQMLQQTFPFVIDTPPILVDWLPWHHTFGGNHNLNLVLYNGGTLYIDEGKPTPAQIGITLANLREISPTIYFNVPKGWEDLALVMQQDRELRDTFFQRMQMLFYAAAGLSQTVWSMIDELAVASCGEKIRMLAGLGMTETSPSAMFCAAVNARAGEVGVPCPGVDTKLVPVEEKLEVRFRGPNVMSGYWRAPELNADVFDEEGFLRTGDALKPIDPDAPERGFLFDGRLAEDFKLSSGTFVSVGPMRAKLIAAGAPYIQDVVLAGLNRDNVAALIFPRPDVCVALAKSSSDTASVTLLAALKHPAVCKVFECALQSLNQGATGSASRIERAVVMSEPASLDKGEITDKGSINQRAVLTHRAQLIEAIYLGSAPDLIFCMPRTSDS